MRSLSLKGLAAGAAILFTCLWVYLNFGKSVFSYQPHYNDEIRYFREILTFTRAGFGGGYYSYEENSAPGNLPLFGAHGPLFSLIYGFFGKILGWSGATAIFLNFLLVFAANLIFIRAARLSTAESARLALFQMSFPALLLYLPTLMQESLHFSIAAVLAAAFHRLITQPERGKAELFLLVFIPLISFIRPSWVVMLFPFTLLSLRNKSRLLRYSALFPCLIATALAFKLYGFFTTPYPDSFNASFFQTLAISKDGAMKMFLLHGLENLSKYFSWNTDPSAFTLQRYQIFLLMAGSAIVAIKSRDPLAKSGSKITFFALASIFALVISCYDVFGAREFRNMAPFLAFGLLLSMALRRNFWGLGAVMLSNIVIFPFFLGFFKTELRPNYEDGKPAQQAFAGAIQGKVRYDPEASPWCNTLLYFTPQRLIVPLLVELPPEIGLSVVYELERLALPPKSKYLIMDRDSLEKLKPVLHMEHLAETPIGNVFLNLDANCKTAG